MRIFSRSLATTYKLLRVKAYNRKHRTRIESSLASVHATYGFDVHIAQDTYVSSDVKIGDYSYVNRGSSIENCEIGKFCSISSGVYICPLEHKLNFRTTHPIAYSYDTVSKRSKVIIGHDVLISLNAIILEGIQIGDGAVIGAGAVVTKDVKPYEIVGGIPAKHIRFRFEHDEIESIQNSNWWDWDITKIKKNTEYLRNKTHTIID